MKKEVVQPRLTARSLIGELTPGMRMSGLFQLAKRYSPMGPDEIERLLDSDLYEARVAAVSIMDFQSRDKKVWERRTAIVSTYFFIRQNDITDTFKIAGLLVNDGHEAINKAVGSWIREAGKKDPVMLFAFLDKHAATMPRVTLRYAVEKLDKKSKDRYMSAGK